MAEAPTPLPDNPAAQRHSSAPPDEAGRLQGENWRILERLASLRAGTQAQFDARRAALNLLEDAEEARRAEQRELADRQRADAALRASEEKYRALFEQIDEGYCVIEMIFDAAGRPVDFLYLETNPAFVRHAGQPMAGRRIREVVPDFEPVWLDRYGRVAVTGETVHVEDRVRGLGDRWFAVSAFRLGGEDSRQVAVLFTNITERKQAEAARRAAEERYRTQLFASMGEGYVLGDVIFDAAGQPVDLLYLEANPAAVRMAGTELVGRRTLEFNPACEPYWFEIFGRVARTGVGERHELAAASLGAWYNVYCFKVSGPEARRVAAVYQDITERKRREAHLAFLADFSQRLLTLARPAEIVRIFGEEIRGLFGASACAFAEIEATGHAAAIRDEWHRADLPDLRGQYRLADHVSGEFAAQVASGNPVVVRDVAGDRRILNREKFAALRVGSFVTLPLPRGGAWRHALGVCHEQPHAWRDDEIALLLETANRVWNKLEQTRAEEALRAAFRETEHARAEAEAAGKAKDHFMAVLSHELRTPLMPILMALGALARRKDLPGPVRDALDMIERNVQVEAHFIDDLLDVTRIAHGKIEIVRQPMDLHEAARRAVEVSTPDIEAKGQHLTVALDAPIHRLTGDFTRLQQGMWNLLKNASKFTPEGGAIHLGSRNEPGRVVIEVTDTGIGMEAGVVERIFHPFEQADRAITQQFGGLGLGLAIAKATVEAHGGVLRASSPGPGKGATFTLSLPLDDGSSAATEPGGNEG